MDCTHITNIYEWGKVTDWLTAVGTVGAVVWALYLSRRESRDHIRVTSLVSGTNLRILIYNSGTHLAVLTGATLTVGAIFGVEEEFVRISWGKMLPRLVKPGEHINMPIDLSNSPSYTPDNVFAIWSTRWRFDRSIYFAATTATGDRFRHKFSKTDEALIARKGK